MSDEVSHALGLLVACLFIIAVFAAVSVVLFLLGATLYLSCTQIHRAILGRMNHRQPVVDVDAFRASVDRMTLEEAQERAYALLRAEEGFTLAPVDPAALEETRERVPPALFALWKRFGTVTAEGSVFELAPDLFEPVSRELAAVLPAQLAQRGDLISFPSHDGHSYLVASPHAETVYDMIEGYLTADNKTFDPEVYKSFYHWVCAHDPHPPAHDPTLLRPASPQDDTLLRPAAGGRTREEELMRPTDYGSDRV